MNRTKKSSLKTILKILTLVISINLVNVGGCEGMDWVKKKWAEFTEQRFPSSAERAQQLLEFDINQPEAPLDFYILYSRTRTLYKLFENSIEYISKKETPNKTKYKDKLKQNMSAVLKILDNQFAKPSNTKLPGIVVEGTTYTASLKDNQTKFNSALTNNNYSKALNRLLALKKTIKTFMYSGSKINEEFSRKISALEQKKNEISTQLEALRQAITVRQESIKELRGTLNLGPA